MSSAGPRRPKTITLEIDVNPPTGSGEELTFLDCTADYEVRHRDLSSNFALKIQALLCRPYREACDWLDYSWHVPQGTTPNFALLQAALRQAGPWSGDETLAIDVAWLTEAVQTTTDRIDWQEAGADVTRFLRSTHVNRSGSGVTDFFAPNSPGQSDRQWEAISRLTQIQSCAMQG